MVVKIRIMGISSLRLRTCLYLVLLKFILSFLRSAMSKIMIKDLSP